MTPAVQITRSATRWLALALLLTTPQTQAGRGVWRLANKEVDLYLYLENKETAAALEFSTSDNGKLSYWFNEASKKMWNATEGNLRIGTAYVFNATKNGKDTADVWFLDGPERASANPGGLGQSGTHMFFQMPVVGGSYSVPERFRQNAFVHEFGHYGFGLYDEYLGYIRSARPKVERSWFGLGSWKIEENYVRNKHSGNMSALDRLLGGGYYWGWNGGGDTAKTQGKVFYSTRSLTDTLVTDSAWTSSIMNIDHADNVTEFSWQGDYPYSLLTTDTDSGLTLPGHSTRLAQIVSTKDKRTVLLAAGTYWVSTAQEELHKKSCWSVISTKLGIPELTSAPNTAMPAAYQDIKWVVMAPRRSVELCIDRSGSMYDDDKMEQAKQGAKLFASLASLATADEPGDYLGVVDFDSVVTVTAPIRELKQESDRTAVLNAIDTLYDRNATSIGGGLDRSRLQIESVGTQGAGEMIVLLSDGEENTSPYVSGVLPAVVRRGIKVYTISLGDGANISLMQQIADSTQGKHFYCLDSADLQDAYSQISQLVQAGEVASAARGFLAPGADWSQPVSVNAGATEATFVLNASSAGVEFALRPPSGALITPANLPANVSFTASGSSKFYRVQHPMAGNWTPIVSAPESASGFTASRVEKPAAAIPDGTGAKLVRSLVVSNSAIINKLYPSVALVHRFVGDLKVSLKSPKGTTVVLHNRSGGGGQDLQGTYGDDLWPAESLTPFVGQQARGTWQLIVQDANAGDIGTLQSWGLTFNTADPEACTRYELLTGLQDNQIDLTVSAEQSTVHYPTAAVFHASITAGGPISGAAVTAVVTHPDGETQAIVPMLDDGNRAGGGDTDKNDGVYSAIFSDFTQNGVYQVKVLVTCTNGFIIFAGNSISANVIPPAPAPKFSREESYTFQVAGVPSPMANAVRVTALSISKKTNSYGNVTLSGRFNAEPWQYDPKTSSLRLSLDNFSLYVPASSLRQVGRTFEYRYTNAQHRLTRKLVVTPFRGGTSKCDFLLTLTDDYIGGISFPTNNPTVDVSFTFGSINDSATLYVTSKMNPNGSGTASYRPQFNGELQSALYVDSALVQRAPTAHNQDLLRLVATIPGWLLSSNLAFVPVAIEFGGYRYAFGPGTMFKQRDGTYRGTLDAGKVVLVINPNTRRLQLSANKQSLAAFQNPATVQLTIDYRTQLARLQMLRNKNSFTF